jgi:ATP-dependent RNA helicase DDX49/DBP8
LNFISCYSQIHKEHCVDNSMASLEDTELWRGSSSGDEFPQSPPKRIKTFSENAPSRVRKTVKSKETQEIRHTDPLPTEPMMSSSFEILGVDPWIIASLSAMQITRPTPIQAQAIPAILAGSDCIGGSKTGSGKTVAFSVPILQKWAEDGFGIYALIITPTR